MVKVVNLFNQKEKEEKAKMGEYKITAINPYGFFITILLLITVSGFTFNWLQAIYILIGIILSYVTWTFKLKEVSISKKW